MAMNFFFFLPPPNSSVSLLRSLVNISKLRVVIHIQNRAPKALTDLAENFRQQPTIPGGHELATSLGQVCRERPTGPFICHNPPQASDLPAPPRAQRSADGRLPRLRSSPSLPHGTQRKTLVLRKLQPAASPLAVGPYSVSSAK